MSKIERIGPSRYSKTRSRIVSYNGVVTTVAVSTNKPPSVYDQAREAFANIDRHLAEIGTDKSHVLHVMIYVTDITHKPEFDRAWDEWIDPENLPLRACVGVELEGDDLVELIVTAAMPT